MPKATDQRPARRADALRFFGASLIVTVTLLPMAMVLTHNLTRPRSTTIALVDEPRGWPIADPAALAVRADPSRPMLRLGFVGDIMQHRAQAESDFVASYARVKPVIERFDLAVGNLEFPVDPARPVGPPTGTVQFNGSPDHLDALRNAGFDVLSTTNNHSFDQGLEGLTATLDALAERGILGVGASVSGDSGGLQLVETGGIRIGFVGYTFSPNSYENDEGDIDYWSADWPIHELNFVDWTAEFRAEGTALFADHAERSKAESVDLLVALVHWGEEWHFQPTADQRMAAHDMIDAGFDLVIGGHSHVLNPPELYRGKLIAYSLGNFISDFVELEVRTGAILEVTVGTTGPNQVGVVDFAYRPVMTRRDGHVVLPIDRDPTGEQAEAWRLARRIVGPAVAPFEGSADPISMLSPPQVEFAQSRSGDPGD